MQTGEKEMTIRIERDTMGEMRVPAEALYGAQTARAIENFPISGLTFPRIFIRALGMIKREGARVNVKLGFVDGKRGESIVRAADEVAEGLHDAHFPLDVFQTGSGTSTNMNANEVIANRAMQIFGREGGGIHPNDHVNFGQSSNDVFPTAIHLSVAMKIKGKLLPALETMREVLQEKSERFHDIVTIGRTHLQDATPIRLGQVFSGYARQVEMASRRLEESLDGLMELPLGGTAVGTGMNTDPRFAPMVIESLASATGLPFREAANHFEGQGARDAAVATSAALRGCAVSLFKIANDIRFLGSGPRCGLGELLLPAVQPGSSIMPGKVNPVMAESFMQVCAQVVGNDAAVTVGGLVGNFELNTMMPLMAHNLLQSVSLLSSAASLFTDKCLREVRADRKRCESMVEQSLAMATALAPIVGYDRAARIAKKAHETGRTVRETAMEEGLEADVLEKILDPTSMTQSGFGGKKG